MSPSIFETDDLKVAAIALATGAAMLTPDVNTTTGRMIFRFDLPLDFEAQVLSGTVTINGKAIYASLETVHRILRRHQRARGPRAEGDWR